MPSREIGALYRLYAAHCLGIAKDISDPARKLALLDMAQAWAALAEQAENSADAGLLYDTGIPRTESPQN